MQTLEPLILISILCGMEFYVTRVQTGNASVSKYPQWRTCICTVFIVRRWNIFEDKYLFSLRHYKATFNFYNLTFYQAYAQIALNINKVKLINRIIIWLWNKEKPFQWVYITSRCRRLFNGKHLEIIWSVTCTNEHITYGGFW